MCCKAGYLEEGDVVDVQLGKHWIVGKQADGSIAGLRGSQSERTEPQ